jgi:ubiquinone/menaquinone biosynthesis C-methylase UbiE
VTGTREGDTRLIAVETDLAGTVDGVAERLVPEQVHGQIVEAEHLARYHWAAALAGGRRVLDAGCGTAYGSAILAGAGAKEVVGVDVAGDVLAAVGPRMPDGVRLEEADVANLPFEDGSFDLVVCFEVIEHMEDTDVVLDELARVLAEDGVLAISSPNRDVYMPGNPHHVHEFVPEELEEALGKRFARVRLYRQADWVASAVLDDGLQTSESEEPLHDVELRKSATETLGGELYVLALASNGTLPEPQPSVVLSSAAEIASLAEGWQQLDRERRELARRTIQAEGAAEEARRETAELGRQLVRIETELARARQAIARHDDELTEERAIRGEVTTRLEETERQLQRQVEQLNQTIREMQETRAWRVGSTFWRWRDRLLRRRAS